MSLTFRVKGIEMRASEIYETTEGAQLAVAIEAFGNGRLSAEELQACRGGWTRCRLIERFFWFHEKGTDKNRFGAYGEDQLQALACALGKEGRYAIKEIAGNFFFREAGYSPNGWTGGWYSIYQSTPNRGIEKPVIKDGESGDPFKGCFSYVGWDSPTAAKATRVTAQSLERTNTENPGSTTGYITVGR